MIKNTLLFSFTLLCSLLISAQKSFGFQYDKDIPNVVMVINVFKTSPADKAGLLKDDLIFSINGDEKVGNYSNEEFKKLISTLPEKGVVFQISRNSKILNLVIDKADYSSFEFFLLSGNGNSGKCTLANYSGFKIEGSCKNGMANGEGKFYEKTGKLFYEGGFRNNKRHGFGKEYVPKGRYETTFADDKFQGKGRFYFLDQTYMDATWIDDKMEGTVHYFTADGKPWKTEIYKNNKKISTPDSSQNIASNIKSNSTKSNAENSQTSEEELQNLNIMLAKDAGLLKTTVKISAGIITVDNAFDKYEAKIGELAEIRIDDKNNEVVLFCKAGPYCVKQNKFVLIEGITFKDITDFDKQGFAKKMQKILIGYGGKTITENSMKITAKTSSKKYEQELDKVNDAMPKTSSLGKVNLKIETRTLVFSDGILYYSMYLVDMGKVVLDEKNKTVSITCKNVNDCVNTALYNENKMNFTKFKGTDAAGFAKLLQSFVSSYDGL